MLLYTRRRWRRGCRLPAAGDRMAREWHPPRRDPPIVQPSRGRGLASSFFSLLIVSSQSRSGRRQQGHARLHPSYFFLISFSCWALQKGRTAEGSGGTCYSPTGGLLASIGRSTKRTMNSPQHASAPVPEPQQQKIETAHRR